jgi:hypothetical protein
MFSCVLISLLSLFAACKKPCTLTEKEGYKIVGDDKNCYYELIGENGEKLEIEIPTVAFLEYKLPQIEKDLSSGKTVVLKIKNQMATTEEQFLVLETLCALQKTYSSKLTVDWNGKELCPAQAGVLLTFYQWSVLWNRMPLGVNESGGAKGVILWDVGENELPLFIEAGVNGAVLAPGGSVYTINTYEDLHNAPAAIIAGYQPGKLLRLKFNQTLPEGFRNGADEVALYELFAGNAKGKFELHNPNSQKKQFWATDSINVRCATVLHGLGQMLEPALLGGGRYAFINLVAPNSLDSVPGNQFVRILQINSDKLNWGKFAPNKINIVHEWNVTTIPSQIYDTWKSDIRLEAADRPDLPGGRQNIVACNDKFLDYLSEPAGAAKDGVLFNFVADQDIMLTEYSEPGGLPPPLRD